MADLTLRLELSFGGKSLRLMMAAAMAALAATEVASESVTLTTYYPAPSGVYTQMITTQNTYLVRDSQANPNSELKVGMNAGVTGYLVDIYSYKTNNFINNGAVRATFGGGALGGAEFAALANKQNAVSGAWQWAAVYGNQGTGHFAGNFIGEVRATGSIKSEATACRDIDTVTGATCVPGEYITTIAGFYAKKYALTFANYSQNLIPNSGFETGIAALCCPCPVTSGCTF